MLSSQDASKSLSAIAAGIAPDAMDFDGDIGTLKKQYDKLSEKIDSLKEELDKIGEDKGQGEREHRLKTFSTEEEIKLKRIEIGLKRRELILKQSEAKFSRWAKGGGVVFAVTYVIAVAYFLHSMFLDDSADKLLDEKLWHISVAIVAGSFLSMFGTVALVLKGIFKSQDESAIDGVTPESIKTIIETVKTLGSKGKE